MRPTSTSLLARWRGNLVEVPPGRTLQEELDAGHIFILDYAIVEGIPCPEGRHCAAGLGLLHACEGSPLRPIAIQLHQDGGPVWTPRTGPWSGSSPRCT